MNWQVNLQVFNIPATTSILLKSGWLCTDKSPLGSIPKKTGQVREQRQHCL